MTISDVILCFLFLIFALAIYGFFDVRSEQRKDNANRRFLELRQWKLDANGNPPVLVDPYSFDYQEFTPGNAPYPDLPDNIIVGNSPYQKIEKQPLETKLIITAPLNARIAGTNMTVGDLTPERLPERFERSTERLPNGEIELERRFELPPVERSVNDIIREKLVEAKKRGEPKQASIAQITGLSKGGGKWKDWSVFWDDVEV